MPVRSTRILSVSALLAVLLSVAGCGFHLRRSAVLPAGMQQVHVAVSGDADLAAQLERELRQAGADIADRPGVGVAELTVPVARFTTRALSVSDYAQVREYSVDYHVQVQAADADGKPLLKPQAIDMQREFTYDQTQALGTATREEQIRASLVTDMARAVLRRLQAVATRPSGD